MIRKLTTVLVYHVQSALIVAALIFCLCIVNAFACWGTDFYTPFQGPNTPIAWLCRVMVFLNFVFWVSLFRITFEKVDRPHKEDSLVTIFSCWLVIVAIIVWHILQAKKMWDPEGVRFQHLEQKQ